MTSPLLYGRYFESSVDVVSLVPASCEYPTSMPKGTKKSSRAHKANRRQFIYCFNFGGYLLPKIDTTFYHIARVRRAAASYKYMYI